MNKAKLLGIIVFAGLFAFATNSMLHADTIGGLLPIGDGFYREWTPKISGPHYEMVNEIECNGLTDYNFTSTVGKRDSYIINISAIPNGSTITSIAISPCASANKGGAGITVMDVFYRLNSVQSADEGDYALPRTTLPHALRTTVFDDLSYIKTASSSLEIGAVYSAGRRGVRLSHLVADITFSPVSSSSPTVTPTPASFSFSRF